MKRKNLFACFLIVFGNMLIGCNDNGSDRIEFERQYNESLSVFEDFKVSSGNSYIYTTQITPTLIGTAWETTITVNNGRVVGRSFKYTRIPEGMVIPDDEREWTEDETQLNSDEHKESYASETITLDEVYEKAKNEWLLKRKGYTVYFRTDNDGMISYCGYIPNNIADVSLTGINIKEIKALN